MRHLIAALALAFATAIALPAARASDVPEAQAEASLDVSGTIDVDAQGAVTGYTIKKESSYPEGILALVAQLVPTWRFEPVLVDGKATAARAKMNMKFIARKRADDSVAVALRSAWFGNPGKEGKLRVRDRIAPQFPRHLMQDYVSGTVYVVMRVEPDGHVGDAIAEQTNLRKSGTEIDMARWRRDLERAAVATMLRWRFLPFVPDEGESATSVRVPVDFIMPGTIGQEAATIAGRWDSYLPGPRVRAPWLRSTALFASGSDAQPAGTIQEVGSGLKLLTPLNGG